MKVVITGGAGFLGRKLAQRLLDQGTLVGRSGRQERIDELVLFDVGLSPVGAGDPRVSAIAGDVGDPAQVAMLIGNDTDSVFHLAAVVSAGAEADFDLGWRVNLDGTRNVLEACRRLRHPARLVFTSSIAVYGGDLPDPVTDATILTPRTSYGAQKAACELLINDCTRKGYLDGRALRLPTITVRTGKPNKAASTWASSIIREPLSGVDAVCPVRPDSSMACLSPRRTIDAFIRAHDLPGEALGSYRSLLLSGIAVTAAEMEAAMRRNAGNRRTGRVLWQPDPQTQAIVDGWPRASRGARADALGFTVDASIDEIVQAFIADDLDEQIRAIAAG
ncbi:MAG: D-erythronate dehydrogenase [Reyranellaceae bacterium]